MTATIWPEGTDLTAVLYTDGTNHLVMVQPPHSGQIPPPYIGSMAYQGPIEWPFGNGSKDPDTSATRSEASR